MRADFGSHPTQIFKEEPMDTQVGRARIAAGGTLMILLAAALAAGCGVSKAKYLEVTQSRDDLTARSQQLQANLDAANKDKAQLESDKAALEARVKEMETTAQQLGTELEQQKKQAEDFKSTY